MDDGALVNAVAQGDDLALRELFQRHAPWLAARLRRALPPDAVEDVLQETFLALWKGARSYQGSGEVAAWLWGIARRQAALWLRRRGRAEGEVAPDAPAQDDPAALAVERAEVHRALAALGPPGSAPRELVRLLWEEGRSVAEAAAHLGIPAGTVKSRLHRVRRLLRAVLRGGGQHG